MRRPLRFLREHHPLGDAVVARARSRALMPTELAFDLSGHAGKISLLEPFQGRSGWLAAELLAIASLGQQEEHLLCAALADDGTALTDEAVSRLWTLPGVAGSPVSVSDDEAGRLRDALAAKAQAVERSIGLRNAGFFQAEAAKLDGWADDLKVGLEREIREIDGQIKEARRAATAAVTLEQKLDGQKALRALELQRAQKRRSLFDAQDEVDARRAALIDDIQARMRQDVTRERLFVARWTIT